MRLLLIISLFICFIISEIFLSDYCNCQNADSTITGNNESSYLEQEIKAINSKGGVLYLGIDNVISLPDKFLHNNNIFITTDNGIIFKDSADCIIIPRRLPFAGIFVHEVLAGDTVLIFSKTFKVIYVPTPCITINNQCIEEMEYIPRRYFLENDSLGIYITDDVIGSENWIRINRFTLGYVYGSVYVSFHNDGPRLSDETKHAIKNMRPWQEVSINVYIESEGKIVRHIPILSVIIL